ncbi:unnamed protein product [Protopolystoma xenopodis]|uniref:Uncharacterized protein n=1 Tax=Protopolystoma xenopodis TaxID=117903 RepID=A0A448XJC2_9PLAT|nr:unnamed protein product [Protopolystoma xenopodis]
MRISRKAISHFVVGLLNKQTYRRNYIEEARESSKQLFFVYILNLTALDDKAYRLAYGTSGQQVVQLAMSEIGNPEGAHFEEAVASLQMHDPLARRRIAGRGGSHLI